MKIFNTSAAMLMLVMSMLSGNSALAQTPAANCSPLHTNAPGVLDPVGAVCVTVNPIAGNVFLDYLLIGDWKLSEANAWIGDNASSLPKDGSGNPQVSVFQHSASNLGDVNQHSFVIPFSELTVNAGTFCSADVIVAASAVVTRTIAGEPGGGGKSDKSSKSGKNGKSDKSDKSGKSGQSDKSAKNSKSDSSSAKDSKGKNQSAKNGKSSAQNDSSSLATNVVSTKSGKSGQSNKSSKSGKSGATGGGTGPVTQTFTAWAGDTVVGDGSYFSFKNDFCAPPPPVITLPRTCYNTYARSAPVRSFVPIGITDASIGWVNSFPAGITGINAALIRLDTLLAAGNLLAIRSNGTMQVNISNFPASFYVAKAHIYYGAADSFTSVSPLLYGTTATSLPIMASISGPFSSVTFNLTSSSLAAADLVVHAMFCPLGTSAE